MLLVLSPWILTSSIGGRIYRRYAFDEDRSKNNWGMSLYFRQGILVLANGFQRLITDQYYYTPLFGANIDYYRDPSVSYKAVRKAADDVMRKQGWYLL